MNIFAGEKQIFLISGILPGRLGAITIRSSKNTGRELREIRNHAGEAAYKIIKKEYNDKVKSISQKAEDSKKQLSNMFRFSEEVFGEGQEILIIVTDLTANYNSARFISEFGCEEYFKHNKELLFYERQKEIIWLL